MNAEERAAKIERLRVLEAESDAIRKELKLHGRGEVVWEGEVQLLTSYDRVTVTSDGYGKYTVDQFTPWGCETLHKQDAGPFDNLDEAIAKAEQWAEAIDDDVDFGEEFDEDDDDEDEEDD